MTAPLGSMDEDAAEASPYAPPAPAKKPWIVLGSLIGAVVVLLGAVLYLSGVFDRKQVDNSPFVRPTHPGSGRPTDPGTLPTTPDGKGSTGVTLRGGGSTFVAPMMDHWSGVYEKEKGVKIEYQRLGSSKGVSGVLDKLLDFGGTDAYVTDEYLKKERITKPILHVPLVMGAVVPTYNLPEAKKQLRFTGSVLAKIYLGEITHWDDSAMMTNNPGVALPHKPIVVVRRQDGSGTTFIWTDYLCKVNETFKNRIGGKPSTQPNWPRNAEDKEIGIEAKGNDGIAKEVNRHDGAIGYVELTFALGEGLQFGQVKNDEGVFISPTLETVTAAAFNSLEKIPDDLRFTLTNAPGQASYPICGTAWAVIYADQPADKGKELVTFLRWCVHDGQKYTRQLKYAPLPDDLVKRVDVVLDRIPGGR
jgi:phosphate transport system substrate-binding protein